MESAACGRALRVGYVRRDGAADAMVLQSRRYCGDAGAFRFWWGGGLVAALIHAGDAVVPA